MLLSVSVSVCGRIVTRGLGRPCGPRRRAGRRTASVSVPPAGEGTYAQLTGAGTAEGLWCRWGRCLQGATKRARLTPDSGEGSCPCADRPMSLPQARALDPLVPGGGWCRATTVKRFADAVCVQTTGFRRRLWSDTGAWTEAGLC